VISANQTCPQPQTSEHLVALDLMGINQGIIIQNKIDLVNMEKARQNFHEIVEFTKPTNFSEMTIIPVCANRNLNTDSVCEHLAKLEVPTRDLNLPPIMYIVRSFDVNKPGEKIESLQGGVAGGSLLQGVLKIGQLIEIRPGRIKRLKDGTILCYPLRTTVISLNSDKNTLKVAHPGGLIGVGTEIDPSYAKADGLVGQIIGLRDQMPPIFTDMKLVITQ